MGWCNRHFLAYSAPSCPQCQDEANKKLRSALDDMAGIPGFGSRERSSFITSFWQGYNVVKQESTAMTQPTPEQLQDPQWWDERAGTASHYCPANKQFYDARLHPCCVARPKPQPAAAEPEPQPDHPWEFGDTRSKERTVEIDITDGRVTVCRVIASTDPLIDCFAGARGALEKARLIVKSVNNHHRLTSALKDLLHAATLEHIEEAADALEAAGVTPILPGHCPKCGGFPCGHYIGCPAEAAKPDSQEWDGGLPPIDSSCKYYSVERSEWRIGRVIAHRNGCAVIEDGDGVTYQATPPDDLRPIRSQAEREREEVIAGALNVALHPVDDEIHPRQYLIDSLNALYDAGMLRKGGSQ